MIGWLWRMIVGDFGGCKHKWATFTEQPLNRRDDPNRATVGIIYGQRCEKCGDITQRYVGLQ